MENDVLDCLNDIGYTGPLSEEGVLKEAVAHGAKSLEFTELVAYLSTELQALCNLDDRINPIKDPDHASSFLLEVSSFLKELDCPYKALLDGNVNQRLGCRQNCLLLLYFLLTELLAAKMVQHESTTASSLKKILMSWGFNKPPANISSGQVFSKLDIKVPDRGGRPQEQEPLPPEMPSWQQRSAPSQAGGNNSIQGGWNKGNRGWSQRGGSDRYQGVHDKYQPQRQDQHCYDYQNTGQDQYSSSQDGYGVNSNRRGRGGHRGWGRGGRRGY